VAEKFVRFVTHEPDEVTGISIGFFEAAYQLRDDGHANAHDANELKVLIDWFRENLDPPDRFSRSKNRHAHGKALSWFRPAAVECIDKARSLLIILERYGIASEMLTTARPGMIVYEDEWQIAAIPFSDRDF
jgi:hypothetical protein